MEDAQSQTALPSKHYMAGLDSLRFCAALAVVVAHLASNLSVQPEGRGASFLWQMASVMANGPAAVAMFFVISGFCIHIGQAQSLKVEAPVFLARRGLRIGIPLIVATLLAYLLGDWAAFALKTVLWSVYCELAYYLFYPLFLKCRRRMAMPWLLLASLLLSASIVIGQEGMSFIQQYGAATAIVCFPLWVAGAWLAERHLSAQQGARGSIMGWRCGALMIGVLSNLVGNSPLLIFAAAGLFCWHYIPRELARWQRVPPFPVVERLGRMSYSLYLVHVLPIALAIQFAADWSFGQVVTAEAVAIGLTAYCFFMLCERPSHQLARRIGRRGLGRHDGLTRGGGLQQLEAEPGR